LLDIYQSSRFNEQPWNFSKKGLSLPAQALPKTPDFAEERQRVVVAFGRL